MRLYLVGDSISVHYGPWLEKYLGSRFVFQRRTGEEEALADLDRPRGANGGDSRRVKALLEEAARDNFRTDLLLVNCGLHDQRRDPETGELQVPLEEYRCNLARIASLAGALSAEFAWVRTTPLDEKVHNNRPGMKFHRFEADHAAYDEAAISVMAGQGIAVLDLCAFTLNLGTDLYCDHVHFHEPVRRLQAAYIAGWVSGRAPGAGSSGGRRP